MSIRGKLLTSFGALLVLLLGVGGVGWYSSHRLEQQAAGLYHDNVRGAVALGAAQSALWELRYGFPQFMASPDTRQGILDAEPKLYQRIDEALAAYSAGDITAAERAALDEWNRIFTLYREARPKWFELYGAGRLVEAADWRAKTTTPYGKDAVAAMARLIELQQSSAEARYQQVAGIEQVVIGLVVCSAVLGLGFAVVLSGRLTRRLGRIADALRALAGGDLTHRIPDDGRDEIAAMGQVFNSAVAQVGTTITAIGDNAGQLARAASDLSGLSERMDGNAARTTNEAESASDAIAHVSAGISSVAGGATEMTRSIRNIAQNAEQALRIADSGKVTAAATNETIGRLDHSSGEISEVAKLITSIAEQTNLLALNATIEAARAGEAGKGFAVVASEVKDLAQETAKATDQIGSKIAAIQASAREAIDAIGQITSIIEQVNDAQSTIASAVEQQLATSNEMGRSGTEAATGSADVAATLASLSSVARATNEDATATLHAAGKLTAMAGDLRGLMSQFRVEASETRR
jgi:methyl-accepting chemotaxis protein